MHRILLIVLYGICFLGSFHCTNKTVIRRIELPKSEFPYTKRLPFIVNTCYPLNILQRDKFAQLELVSIWEDGHFRKQILGNELFDAIEDLRIYQSHEYFWELRLIPYFSKYDCNEYHITGYLLYFDSITKQKMATYLDKKRKDDPIELPIMLVREYELADSETLKKKQKADPVNASFHTKYSTAPDHRDPFSNYQIWESKPKSELLSLSDSRLIAYCLDFPYECATDSNYIHEFKNRISKSETQSSESFNTSFQTNLKREIQKTNFGCYCRLTPDLSIYKSCPIDNFGLDSICKEKTDCSQNKNDNNICTKKYKESLLKLINSKESKDIIHSGSANFDRMVYYAKKFLAFELLNELSNGTK
ncbi:hypothetical protein LEP1GSC202_2627 [Leptospira yanagawae serovar Saopaulo str. Sao Paulo = ATCC 700523]|uniref:Uncharacterized protein n=1 Tax=Leptospira yanagawae serovar Saopaulo str. Sao Paulo = ATCC 700523 TaxID=1249483 RepID=A0A5E8H984_9LEPT|nr:hypothetical protein [Leptospira yanagawae]EOQ87759.1 hypothetical protein LEP1GSC202_2627 [Leptospira yanagawae serovar Saopaulo str. Sao Paulo = ATCC 700523]